EQRVEIVGRDRQAAIGRESGCAVAGWTRWSIRMVPRPRVSGSSSRATPEYHSADKPIRRRFDRTSTGRQPKGRAARSVISTDPLAKAQHLPAGDARAARARGGATLHANGSGIGVLFSATGKLRYDIGMSRNRNGGRAGPVTIHDVAKAARVSVGTVFKALNG